MKANREDVVQAALMVQRYCEEHFKEDCPCDCPFGYMNTLCRNACALYSLFIPQDWNLEEFLRTRGLKHET